LYEEDEEVKEKMIGGEGWEGKVNWEKKGRNSAKSWRLTYQ
jgi:hypothetical protein